MLLILSSASPGLYEKIASFFIETLVKFMQGKIFWIVVRYGNVEFYQQISLFYRQLLGSL